MLGTLVNALAIIAGSLLGLLFSRGIPENFKQIILTGVGLSVLLIGMKSALVTNDLMIVIFSVIIGAICGEALKIEDRLEQLGRVLEKKFPRNPVTPALLPGDLSPQAWFFVSAQWLLSDHLKVV